jgi:hypothetical protein
LTGVIVLIILKTVDGMAVIAVNPLIVG